MVLDKMDKMKKNKNSFWTVFAIIVVIFVALVATGKIQLGTPTKVEAESRLDPCYGECGTGASCNEAGGYCTYQGNPTTKHFMSPCLFKDKAGCEAKAFPEGEGKCVWQLRYACVCKSGGDDDGDNKCPKMNGTSGEKARCNKNEKPECVYSGGCSANPDSEDDMGMCEKYVDNRAGCSEFNRVCIWKEPKCDEKGGDGDNGGGDQGPGDGDGDNGGDGNGGDGNGGGDQGPGDGGGNSGGGNGYGGPWW